MLTLTQVHTFDALSYILDVDRKPWPELFHPHHLAYGPLGALTRNLALALGWKGSSALPIQSANALAGAAGVAIFFSMTRRTTGRPELAAAGALLLGSSYAFWYYAVEVEVYTIASLFLIIALAIMIALLHRPSPALAAALGCAQAFAVLFHQTNALLCLPVGVALLLGGRQQAAGGRQQAAGDRRQAAGDRQRAAGDRRQAAGSRQQAAGDRQQAAGSRRQAAGGRQQAAGSRQQGSAYYLLPAAYALPLALIVVGAYLWVGLGVSGFRSWGDLSTWMAGYAQTGWWGGAVDEAKLAGLGMGLSRTLSPPGWEILPIGLLAILLANLRGLRAAPRSLVWALLTWLLTYGAFFLWWEPDNIEFWIASLPPFYLLLLLGVGGRWSVVGGRWSFGALILIGLTMLAVNLGAIRQRGDASTDLQRAIVDALAARSVPGDLLVVPDGLLELYLPYYAGRENITSLNQAMAAAGGDWPTACELMRGRIDQALASGYAALVADEAMRPVPAPPGEPPTMMERFKLTPDQVSACYAPLAPMIAALDLGAGLPAYGHILSAQEIVDGAGWDFARGGWGWRTANTSPATAESAGWALVPETDPSLSSPPLQIDTSRYGEIEVRMAAGTAARDAQLFFLDAAGQAREDRSLRWQLDPGPEMHSYRLSLRAAPGWSGVIGGLRLDPVGAGDGGTITIEAIRLLP